MNPSIRFLDDQAVYRRTPAGQRELLDPKSKLSAIERRLLGVVTGHTPLRVLLDMIPYHPEIAAAILALLDRRLLMLQETPGIAEAARQRQPDGLRRSGGHSP